jgi:hypothetical protein
MIYNVVTYVGVMLIGYCIGKLIELLIWHINFGHDLRHK